LLHEIGFLITAFNSQLHNGDEDVTMTELCVTKLRWLLQDTNTNTCLEGNHKCAKTIHIYTDSNHIHTNAVLPNQYSEKPTSATTTFSQI